MSHIPLFTRFYTSQVVQDFFHQQYFFSFGPFQKVLLLEGWFLRTFGGRWYLFTLQVAEISKNWYRAYIDLYFFSQSRGVVQIEEGRVWWRQSGEKIPPPPPNLACIEWFPIELSFSRDLYIFTSYVQFRGVSLGEKHTKLGWKYLILLGWILDINKMVCNGKSWAPTSYK